MHKRRGTRDIRPGRKGLEAKAIRRGQSELRRIGDPEDSGVGNIERWEHDKSGDALDGVTRKKMSSEKRLYGIPLGIAFS